MTELAKPLRHVKAYYTGKELPVYPDSIYMEYVSSEQESPVFETVFEHTAYMKLGVKCLYRNKIILPEEEFPKEVLRSISEELYGDIRSDLYEAAFHISNARKGSQKEDLLKAEETIKRVLEKTIL